MELLAAVASGLNPSVAALVILGLAASGRHLPPDSVLARLHSVAPPGVLSGLLVLLGLLVSVDLIASKLPGIGPRSRRFGPLLALGAGAFLGAGVSDSGFPWPLVAAATATVAWAVSMLLAQLADRASRSPAWVGLGHVPVLMAATTTAAVAVPLGLVNLGVALSGAVVAVAILAVTAWRSRRHRRVHSRAYLRPTIGYLSQRGW